MSIIVSNTLVALLFFVTFFGCEAQPEVDEAILLAKAVDEAQGLKPDQEEQNAADAATAHTAAHVAKQAAKLATKVANSSVEVIHHATHALKDAHDAIHDARVNSHGLSRDQKDSLKEAEKRLHEATKSTEYGQLQDAKYLKVDVANKNLKNLENKMQDLEKKRAGPEVDELRKEIDELRKRIKDLQGKVDADILEKLEKQLEELKNALDSGSKSIDEIKAEVERIRERIQSLEKQVRDEAKASSGADATPVADRGFDIDTQMPYGDLEPFGREDTAQELTEASIHESDEMVDQIERAEVAEEKRAVFRALTRLRGAAITSYDGVARTQTGNIDNYNSKNQWRQNHPVHHLADEESDVQKWAFPDNAD